MKKKLKIKISVWQFLALGYLAVILFGSILLILPFATQEGQTTDYLNALFTAISATCVTGLSPYDTGAHWSLFGQIVILILIQTGGLGFMTFVSTVFRLLKGRMGMYERKAFMASAGSGKYYGLGKMIKRIFIGTALFEFLGAVILCFRFVGDFGWADGIYFSVWHSVSAFCNAGFDVCGTSSNPYGSLSDYNGNAGVLLIISLLSILGAFGFTVINDILRNKFRFKRYRLHTKLVLLITPILMLSGTFFFLASEWNADATAGMNGGQKLLNSLFQSVMASSTAGFSSLDQTKLSPAGVIYTCILMFIGSSPGGTGGGIKTTTFALLFWMAVSGLRGKEEIIMFKHSINIKTGLRAIAVAALALIVVFTGALIISASDSYLLIKDVFFETLTAFTTTGLSMGSTTTLNPNISNTALYVLSVVMFIGRLGPLSVGMIFAKQDRSTLKYPASSLMIG